MVHWWALRPTVSMAPWHPGWMKVFVLTFNQETKKTPGSLKGSPVLSSWLFLFFMQVYSTLRCILLYYGKVKQLIRTQLCQASVFILFCFKVPKGADRHFHKTKAVKSFILSFKGSLILFLYLSLDFPITDVYSCMLFQQATRLTGS